MTRLATMGSVGRALTLAMLALPALAQAQVGGWTVLACTPTGNSPFDEVLVTGLYRFNGTARWDKWDEQAGVWRSRCETNDVPNRCEVQPGYYRHTWLSGSGHRITNEWTLDRRTGALTATVLTATDRYRSTGQCVPAPDPVAARPRF